MATFPSTLPAPLADGYALSPVDPVLRTDMDVGAPRVRRRTRARNDQVTLRWVFQPGQMDTFRDWFDSDAGAAGGAAWFNLLLDLGGGGAQSVEARFAEIWQAERLGGGNWRVSGKIEVR